MRSWWNSRTSLQSQETPTQDEPASDLEIEDETEQEQSTQSSRECGNMRSPESDRRRKRRRSSDYTKTDSSFTSSGPEERRESRTGNPSIRVIGSDDIGNLKVILESITAKLNDLTKNIEDQTWKGQLRGRN